MKILKVDQRRPDPLILREAASVVREGGLVIYPTETVYGLGADALSGDAVKKVYAAKKRDLQNPISIAVSSQKMLKRFAEVPPSVDVVVKNLLPGPLTLILRAKSGISELLVTGGGKVGIRMPSHPVVLELVEQLGKPITSTSANLSGKAPPTIVREALDQLGGEIDLVLDAGKCELGVPSTVVNLTVEPPQVLREGPVKKEELQKIFG